MYINKYIYLHIYDMYTPRRTNAEDSEPSTVEHVAQSTFAACARGEGLRNYSMLCSTHIYKHLYLDTHIYIYTYIYTFMYMNRVK